jgi:uncharacterized protein (UPF0548 family)
MRRNERLLASARTAGCNFRSMRSIRGTSRHRQTIVDIGLGRGEVVFQSCVQQLMSWEMHRAAGINVLGESAGVHMNAVVILRPRLPLPPVSAPCKVELVWARDTTAGFRYATLEGHPERGRETFVVARRPDGEVTFHIRATSVPSWRMPRLAVWIVDRIQDMVTRNYLHVMREAGMRVGGA